jgi:hypothetical protein
LPSLPSWPWTPRTLLRDDRVRRGATRCGPGAFLSWSSLIDDFYMVLVMSGYVYGVIMNHIGVDLLTVSIWGQNSIISYTTNKHAGFMPGYKKNRNISTTEIRGFNQQTEPDRTTMHWGFDQENGDFIGI